MTLRLTTDNEKMAMLIQFIVFNEIKMEVLWWTIPNQN
jgi:hypothetical protein